MTTITKDEFRGLERITVENEQISFSLLPRLGGKMISLVFKENKHEYISLSGRPFRIPAYGANFADYDISGFDECFPALAGRIDLNIIKTLEANQATKFFTTVLEQGWCALHDTRTGDFLKFSFPVEKIPYLGIWINEGGWPLDGRPSYNVALEPCTGCPDKLDTAIQRGEYACLKPRAEQTWSLAITIGRSNKEGPEYF